MYNRFVLHWVYWVTEKNITVLDLHPSVALFLPVNNISASFICPLRWRRRNKNDANVRVRPILMNGMFLTTNEWWRRISSVIVLYMQLNRQQTYTHQHGSLSNSSQLPSIWLLWFTPCSLSPSAGISEHFGTHSSREISFNLLSSKLVFITV